MKNLITFLALVFACSMVSAQTLTIRPGDSNRIYFGTAGDTLDASNTLVKNIYVSKDYFYHANVQVDADSAGNGADIAVRLRGSWDGAKWYNIGNAVNWKVTTSDTTFSINTFTSTETVSSYTSKTASDVTTHSQHTITSVPDGVVYPYLQVYFLGASSSADMKLKRLTIRVIPAK